MGAGFHFHKELALKHKRRRPVHSSHLRPEAPLAYPPPLPIPGPSAPHVTAHKARSVTKAIYPILEGLPTREGEKWRR